MLSEKKYIFALCEETVLGDFGDSKRPLIEEAADACNYVDDTVGHLAQLITNYKLTKLKWIHMYYFIFTLTYIL